MFKKIFIAVLWIEGVLAIAHGMSQDNDAVFIVGIVSVTIGYLIFRKDLKRIGGKAMGNETDIPDPPDEK